MEITLTAVQKICDTLPIGLYAGRKIPLSMSADEKTSFYDPTSDSITISYPTIAQGMKMMADDSPADEVETAIRSMLYHEVSHSVLTPTGMWMSKIYNIFEDERIETLLNDYYLNVNFKKQVYNINGYRSNADIPNPQNAESAFYNLVRFHIGDFALLREVKRIIEKYATMNRTSNRSTWHQYCSDIDNLWDEVQKKFKKSPNNFNNPQYDPNNSNQNSEGQGKGKSQISNAKGNPTSENGETDGNGLLTAEQTNGKTAENGQQTAVQNGAFKVDMPKGQSLDKIFSEGCAPAYDSQMFNKLNAIISSFNKKNNSGSAMRGYSGVINPRNFRHDDYRYFDRQATVNGNNRYGTFHLNLFLDNSGSFASNMEIVNGLLSALLKIEERNPNFSFSVVHCGCGEELITDKKKYGLTCYDGTALDYDAIDLYRQLNQKNTLNHTIVLYDGDCMHYRYPDAFKAFNHSDCTIISDPENEEYIVKNAPKAKQIITRNYTENLIDNVIKTISGAFR